MNKTNKLAVNSALISISAALLAACGGGSGSSADNAQQAATTAACYAPWSAGKWYSRGSLAS